MNDILGIQPYGKAVEHAVKEGFKGVEGFLAATCKPALEEIGLMLRDHVRVWRLNNILKIIDKAKGKLEYDGSSITLTSNPKVALAIVDNGSNEDNDELQEMWAGLFASSILNDNSDQNLMYVNLLKQLTVSEARFLRHCGETTKCSSKHDTLVTFSPQMMMLEDVQQVIGSEDRVLCENVFLHLLSLNIIRNYNHEPIVYVGRYRSNFALTTLGIQLYLKCLGYNGPIKEFFEKKNMMY